MFIKFRGTRGSIPVPGPDTVKYGGNTTCVEIRTDEGDVIILDGGSGIRQLGQELLAQMPVHCSIFLTHTHWDHIQGLPFFAPLFISGNTIEFYGSPDPVYVKDLKTVLSRQMEYCYFPVRESELKSTLHYHNIKEGQVIQVGSATVTPILINHPVLNYGYKVESHGKSFFFTGDYEQPANIYDPEDEEFEAYEVLIRQQRKQLTDLIQGVDVVLADTQYTAEEYPSKKGWGHGSYDTSIELARESRAGALYFTHHDPVRTDAQLDEIAARVAGRNDLPDGTEFHIAIEGTEIQL